jgi:hypothetical protein
MIAGRPGYHFTREPGFGFLLKWHKNNDGTLISQPILSTINFYAMLIKTYGCALLGVDHFRPPRCRSQRKPGPVGKRRPQ